MSPYFVIMLSLSLFSLFGHMLSILLPFCYHVCDYLVTIFGKISFFVAIFVPIWNQSDKSSWPSENLKLQAFLHEIIKVVG